MSNINSSEQQTICVSSLIYTGPFGDEFRNEYGSIRLNKVRPFYYSDIINLEDVERIFKEWLDDHEYFILRGEKPYFLPRVTTEDHDIYSIPDDGHVFYDTVYKIIKASKRGNDVYQYLVSKKLKPLNELENVTFFKDHWGVKKTNLLFVTLTYDTNRCNVNTAWSNIGPEFHLFCNNLRKQYGHIEIFRTWESTQNYYPHVHALIAFKDIDFNVFIHTDKKDKRSFRIDNGSKEKISSYWHSHVDIQGVGNTKGAVGELTKYVTKDLCSDKGHKTNAMIWLHRKQAYSISKGFVGLISGQFAEVVDLSEPKPLDLLYTEMCNCNLDVKKWEFVGILRGVQLGFSPDIWCADLKKPPPRLVALLEYERFRWLSLHGGR